MIGDLLGGLAYFFLLALLMAVSFIIVGDLTGMTLMKDCSVATQPPVKK